MSVKASTSFNHNFQKHAVLTIRKIGYKMCEGFGSSLPEMVAAQMWNIFQSCGISSKKIMVILFGEAKMNLEKSKELYRSCFFGEICAYSEETVRAAQRLLR
jgi:hypothetical protein